MDALPNHLLHKILEYVQRGSNPLDVSLVCKAFREVKKEVKTHVRIAADHEYEDVVRMCMRHGGRWVQFRHALHTHPKFLQEVSSNTAVISIGVAVQLRKWTEVNDIIRETAGLYRHTREIHIKKELPNVVAFLFRGAASPAEWEKTIHELENHLSPTDIRSEIAAGLLMCGRLTWVRTASPDICLSNLDHHSFSSHGVETVRYAVSKGAILHLRERELHDPEMLDILISTQGAKANIRADDVLYHMFAASTSVFCFQRLVDIGMNLSGTITHDVDHLFVNCDRFLRMALYRCMSEPLTDMVRSKLAHVVSSGAKKWDATSLNFVHVMQDNSPEMRKIASLDAWRRFQETAPPSAISAAKLCARLLVEDRTSRWFLDADRWVQVASFAISIGCPTHRNVSLLASLLDSDAFPGTQHQNQDLVIHLLRDLRLETAAVAAIR